MHLPQREPVDLSDEQQSSLLVAMHAAADAAASITLQHFRQRLEVDNKLAADDSGRAFDPVTIADRAAEMAIRDCLHQAFPDIGFFGEESIADLSGNGLLWVVDPIDGTRAYITGMPLWGTLIGLYNGRDAVAGMLDQPVLGERFVASPAGVELVTTRQRVTLHTRACASLANAVLYCTTPDMFNGDALQAFQRVHASVQLVRYGGDCYAYAMLAAGHVDIVLDCDLKPYDIVALIPIIEQAGGIVTDWQGGPAVNGGYVVACGSAELHARVLPLLA